MKLKDFCAILLSLKNQTGTLLSAWIGLLMFIGVPFCIWLYYGGKGRHSGIVGVQLFWSVYLYRSNK